MDRSGEDSPAAAGEIEVTPSPPEPKRMRRCVQSKLSWHLPRASEHQVAAAADEEEGEESEESDDEKKKKKKGKRKKGKSQSREKAQRKSPVTSKEQESNTTNKILERSSQQKQKKPQDAVVLKVGNSKRCKALETITSDKSSHQLKNKEAGDATPRKASTPRKVPTPRKVSTPRKVPTPRKVSTPRKVTLSKSSESGSNSKQRPTNKQLDATMDMDGHNQSTHQPSSDLWLEAKLAAEENQRLFAGKLTHPFFTSRKATKRLPDTQEIKKEETRRWPGLDGDYLVGCPPIHVFDRMDDVASLDWRNWEFMEKTSVDFRRCTAAECSSAAFKGSIKPLNLDTICDKRRDLVQLSDKVEKRSMMIAASCILSDGQDPDGQVHVSNTTSLSSACITCLGNLENGQQQRFLRERMTSVSQRRSCLPECSLWTTKYQPENSVEVCGNSEPVRFLCDWLKCWHERGLRGSKNRKVVEQCTDEDSEDSLYETESDIDDEAMLNNVLLITGPVGSGKSASIYACAKEQGFEVIEVNASDLRNGAHIKQTFGDAVESHGLNQWSHDEPVGQRRKHIFDLLAGSADIRKDDSDSHGMASTACHQDATSLECSWNAAEDPNVPCHVASKTLILFEDVDTVFHEDRGFISTVLQLVGTTRRPIILTSNSKNPVLPQLLAQFVLDFTFPSSGELLSHLHMICVSEKAHISTNLLEHLIRSCLGDIRKSLMLLQFWCQGKIGQIEGNARCSYSVMPFDVDAAHLAIQKMIPWEFPCELSEKVAEEINKTIHMEEENLRCMEEVKQQELNSKETIDLSKNGHCSTTPTRAKKKVLLKRNCSSPHRTIFSDHNNDLDDFSENSGSPKLHVRKRVKHRRGIVLSSQSDDGSSADDLPSTATMLPDLNVSQFQDIHTASLMQSQDVINLFELPTDPTYPRGLNDTIQHPFQRLDIVSTSDICDTFKLQDVSCVPESSFISVDESNKDGYMSLAISSNNTSVNFADFISLIDAPPVGDANNLDRTTVEFCEGLDTNPGISFGIDVESVHGNEVRDLQSEEDELLSCQYQLIDECSRFDFSMRLMPDKIRAQSLEVVSVQETWRKLHHCCEDRKSSLTTNGKVAFLIGKFTSGLTDLISNTDIMFSSCYPLVNDILDPSMMPCVEPDTCSCYDEQLEMGSTYAQHGLCFYSSKCFEAGSSLGCQSTVDLAQEMLTSSSSIMAVGKLLSQGKTTSQNPYLDGGLDVKTSRCGISTGRELKKSTLHDVILSTVPARLSMAVRGSAFYEYSSFLSQIASFECSRLSESISQSKQQQHQRRSRPLRHYLSSGTCCLSPEHVELLAQSGRFKR